MSEKILEFWGKESLVEITEKEIRLYIGIGEVQPFLGRFAAPSLLEQYQAIYASSLSELRKPTEVIPLKSLKRADLIDNNVKIYWEKMSEEEPYSTKTVTVALHEKEAKRLHDTLIEILRGRSFSEVEKKFRVKVDYGKLKIYDPEIAVVFWDNYKIFTLMDPEAFKEYYDEERRKDDSALDRLRKLPPPLRPAQFIGYYREDIHYEDIFKVDYPRKVKGGKIEVKVFLREDVKKIRFREKTNATKFYKAIRIRIPKKVVKKTKQKKTGKLFGLGVIIFISSYAFITSVTGMESRLASLVSLLIGFILTSIIWLVLDRK